MTISRDFKIETHYPSMLSNTSAHPLQSISEWRKGCACSIGGSPAKCEDCTEGLIRHIEQWFQQQSAQVAAQVSPQVVLDVVDYAKDLSSAVGSGKYEDFENIKRSLDEAIDAYESGTAAQANQGLDALPMRPVVLTKDGCVRFKENRIVSMLLERSGAHGREYGYTLSDVVIDFVNGRYTNEELIQLYQLVGYSVSSYGGLNHVTRESASKADAAAELVLAAQAKQGDHDLYETGDPDAPKEIKDGNGEVVLDLCKRCGKAEVELLETKCSGSKK